MYKVLVTRFPLVKDKGHSQQFSPDKLALTADEQEYKLGIVKQIEININMEIVKSNCAY